MKTLNFSISIDAPRAAVWEAMLSPETYKIWAEYFAKGSYYEGSWEKGARIRFLIPDGSGMIAEIAECLPHSYTSIKHLGWISNGVEDTESEEVRFWAPAYENYTLSEAGTSTELSIAVDILPEFEEYMIASWPRALARLKSLCEEGK
ncbi:MAG: SRPBCC domain-containing protein [Bacteroidota bacterium]